MLQGLTDDEVCDASPATYLMHHEMPYVLLVHSYMRMLYLHNCTMSTWLAMSNTPRITEVHHADYRGFACLSLQVRQMDGMLASLEGYL